MYISGTWFLGADGLARPVIHGQLLTGHGTWIAAPFLVDTGADRTVLSAGLLQTLDLPHRVAEERLGGLGSVVPFVVVDTQMRVAQEGGGPIVFRGAFAAVTAHDALDMSVLGRDITNRFAVIVDYPAQRVCLVGQRHAYRLTLR
jgi:hypothetical protein